MVWIGFGIIVLAVAAWWFLRRGGQRVASPPAPGGTPPAKARTGLHKVWGKRLVIPAGSEACQVARSLEGKAFALAKLPAIPLAGCTHANCHCHYEPLTDQRSHLERRKAADRRGDLRFEPGKTDRRSGNDRREENRNPFAEERK